MYRILKGKFRDLNLCKVCFGTLILTTHPTTRTHSQTTSDVCLMWSSYRVLWLQLQSEEIEIWWSKYEPLARIIWEIILLQSSDLSLYRWHPLRLPKWIWWPLLFHWLVFIYFGSPWGFVIKQIIKRPHEYVTTQINNHATNIDINNLDTQLPLVSVCSVLVSFKLTISLLITQ